MQMDARSGEDAEDRCPLSFHEGEGNFNWRFIDSECMMMISRKVCVHVPRPNKIQHGKMYAAYREEGEEGEGEGGESSTI